MSGDRTFHVVEAVVEPGDVGVATLRRRWPDEFKERAIAAALEPGATVRLAPQGVSQGSGEYGADEVVVDRGRHSQLGAGVGDCDR